MHISPTDRRLFLKNTLGLDSGYRLGGKLHCPSHYQWLEQLFHSLMQDLDIRQLFQQLAYWDVYTSRHAFDVFLLGSLLAQHLKWPKVHELAYGLLLHDIGKTTIPRSILTKPTAPSLTEWKLLKTHARHGQDILQARGFSATTVSMAQGHHERLDGSGYPHGVLASDLDDPVRLLAVVDVYSALTLDRPYLQAVSPHRAVHMIRSEVGPLDPRYVRAFCELLGIFPLGASVSLSNGTTAIIVDIDERLPTLPLVKDSQTDNTFYLPIDQTVRIHRWIGPL